MNFNLSPEQLELQQRVREFAQREIAPYAHEYDEKEEFPRHIFEKMGEFGLLGMVLPKEYGGQDESVVNYCIAGEELGAADAAVTLSYGAHAVLCANNIARNANEEQKRKYLPKLASGEMIGALAMTEPHSGSDVLSLRTRAEKRDGYWLLNGRKTYITNAPIADVVLVYARTSPELGPHGISAFLVDTKLAGFKVEHQFQKMGMKASPTGQIAFENMELPEDALMGGENMGLAILMSGLDVERASGGALGVGIARAAFEMALHHARKRRQFKKPIIQYQMIGDKLANMYTEIECARLLTLMAATKCDTGERATLEASLAKLKAAEVAEMVSMEAVQIFGGHGYMRPTGVERLARDAKLLTIGGGTSEIQKMIIIKHFTGEWGTVDTATDASFIEPANPSAYDLSLSQEEPVGTARAN